MEYCRPPSTRWSSSCGTAGATGRRRCWTPRAPSRGWPRCPASRSSATRTRSTSCSPTSAAPAARSTSRPPARSSRPSAATGGAGRRRRPAAHRPTEGTVTEEDAVHRYHGGRREATGFEVADAAVEGGRGRRSSCCGTPGRPGCAAVVRRRGARVPAAAAGEGGGSGAGPARRPGRELGMAPWLVEKAQREVRLLSRTGWPRRSSLSQPPTTPSRRRGARRARPGEGRPGGRGRPALSDRGGTHGGPAPERGPALRGGSEDQALAADLAMADLRFAAWFLWMTPLLTALSSLRLATFSAAAPSRRRRRRAPRGTSAPRCAAPT